MRRLLLASLTVAFAIMATGLTRPEPPDSFDLLIRGGLVLDGTGQAPFKADVGVRSGRIELVGQSKTAAAIETIDAGGLVVSPGFVDVHSHTAPDIAKADRRLNETNLRQGVTTIVGGPDGGLSPGEIRSLTDAYGRNGIGTNVAFYVGHNAIRTEVMGRDHRAPTPAELEGMRALVREGMQLGAVGFSTGLMYEPGMFSRTDEVIALAREAAPFHGIYDSHVRNPAHALLDSDRETIEIGERAGVPPKIAHEKAVGLENKGLIKDVIKLVEAARKRGVNAVTDQYPYDGAATSTLAGIIVVPPEMRTNGEFDVRAGLRDPAVREKLRVASEQGVNGGFAWLRATGYSHMRITTSPEDPSLVGKYLSELAAKRRQPGFDLVSDLILTSSRPIGITLGAVHEDDVRLLMVQPWNMIASDGAYPEPARPAGHPRSTGTFARVLGRYVRVYKLLTLQEAVRKMSDFPARYVGLYDRGRLAPGMAADIVIFDPVRIIDRSTWDEPWLLADGVRDVFVNGVGAIRGGQLTGRAPGKVLQHQTEQTTRPGA